MFKKGVYAATISIINKDYSLNVEETVKHAEGLIKNGLHGVFFFGSTGQSQLISSDEKKVTNTCEGAGKITKLILNASTELSQSIIILIPNNIGAAVRVNPDTLRRDNQIFAAQEISQKIIAK